MLFVAHINACILVFISRYSSSSFAITWMESASIADSIWYIKYLYAYYFAVTIQTTIGFGDLTAKNPFEYVVITFIMLMSAGMFGYILNRMS